MTLAKLANHAAKTWPATGGVVDLTNRDRQRRLMALLPVSEIWGCGRQLTKKLASMGITTALQLADSNQALIRRTFGVVLERTVRELNVAPLRVEHGSTAASTVFKPLPHINAGAA